MRYGKFIYSSYRKQTAMSHVDSLDDETKQLLKDIESQQTHSNDSKESKPPKENEKKKETPKNTETSEYDYSDDKELDDKEW